MTTRDQLLRRIEAERERWRAVVAEVGEGRLEQSGPMGEWTFTDLASHLTGWRERTIARIEAGPGAEPVMPWPADPAEDDAIDAINAWIHEQNRDRPPADILADADRSFERLARALAALPDDDFLTPGRFPWAEGKPLVDADFFAHFHEEHEPSLRAWLAAR